MKLNIEYDPRIELGELTSFIASVKELTYSEAENLMPAWVFEGGSICDDDTEDWSKEVVADLIRREIDAVEVYQDY